MTTTQAQDLKRLAEAATRGTWILGGLESYTSDGVPCRFFYRGDNDNAHTRTRVLSGTGDNGQEFDCDKDAAYIEATNQTLRPQDERLALAFARAIEKALK